MRLACVLFLALPGFAANQPTFTYAVPLGAPGLASTTVAAIAVDAAGNTYLTGTTSSTTFPTTPGALQTQFSGENCGSYFLDLPTPGPGGPAPSPCSDAFLIKLGPSGNVVFATYLGGNGNNTIGTAIYVDADGFIYVGGITLSNVLNEPDTFPVTPGAAFAGGSVFVAKLTPAGNQLVYATPLPFFVSFAMAIDSEGNAYIAGNGNPTPTLPMPGAFQVTPQNSSPAAVVKLNASGSALVYATYLTGSSSDFPMGIAVDSEGAAFIAGATSSHNFPVTPGAFETSFPAAAGHVAGFVTKLNPEGTGLVYSTFLGTDSSGPGAASYVVKADSQGGAYVLMTSSTLSAAFLWHLTTDGSSLIYLIFSQGATALDLDSAGNAFVAGTIAGTTPFAQEAWQSIVAAPWTFQPVLAGGYGSSNAFAMKFSPDGTFDWATYLGGSGQDKGSLIAAGPNGSIVVAGTTTSSNFPGLSTPIPEGYTGGFVTSFFPTLTAMNAAGYSSGAIAPGEVIALRGYGLGPAAGVIASGHTLPDTLAGVKVLISGIPAPLFYVQAQQINAQVPWELAGQTPAQIEVDYTGGISSYATAPVAPAAPAISSVNNSDGTVNSPTNPARAGDFISIYGTGGGALIPAGVTGGFWTGTLSLISLPVSVTIGGISAQVLYPGSVPTLESGYLQINVQIPAGLRSSTASNLVLAIAGASATAAVAIQ